MRTGVVGLQREFDLVVTCRVRVVTMLKDPNNGVVAVKGRMHIVPTGTKLARASSTRHIFHSQARQDLGSELRGQHSNVDCTSVPCLL